MAYNKIQNTVRISEGNSKKILDMLYSRGTDEVRSIIALAERNGQLLQAPNGESTHLSPVQWVYVRTEDFRKFFGESKVLDENQEPLSLYHGTVSHDFATFRNEGNGIYFTPDKEAAKTYGGNDMNPYQVFIRMRNPMEIDFNGDIDTEQTDAHYSLEDEYKNAIAMDYDGVIAYNTFDGENEMDQYVIKNPEDIMLADDVSLLERMGVRFTEEEQINSNLRFQKLQKTPEFLYTSTDVDYFIYQEEDLPARYTVDFGIGRDLTQIISADELREMSASRGGLLFVHPHQNNHVIGYDFESYEEAELFAQDVQSSAAQHIRARQRKLDESIRNLLIEKMQNAGINVVTDKSKGQSILSDVQKKRLPANTDSPMFSAIGERSGAVPDSNLHPTPTIREQRAPKPTAPAGPLTSQIDIAKLRKNTETAKIKIQNSISKGEIISKDTPMDAVRAVSSAIGLDKSSSSHSYYTDVYEGDYDIDGRTARIRISTHPANGTRMESAPTDDRISLVIHKNGSPTGSGNYTEMTFYPDRVSPRESANIIRDIVSRLINEGEILDLSGKAEVQEHVIEASMISSNVSQEKPTTNEDGLYGPNNSDIRYFKTADGGNVYGFVKNGTIYIDPEIATAETPIHEYTHLWVAAVRERYPEEWLDIVDTLKQAPDLWNRVRRDYPELLSDDDIADEVLAQYSGRRGYQQLLADAQQSTDPKTFIEKIADALSKLWSLVADMLQVDKGQVTDDNLIPTSDKEQLADWILKDLLTGLNPQNLYAVSDDSDVLQLHKESEQAEILANNERFNRELEQQVAGTLPTGHIYNLGKPGSILQSAGFPDDVIELSANHLAEKSQQENHPYDITNIKDFVKAINDPIAVFVYGAVNKSQNVITDIEKDNKKFLVGIHFNQHHGKSRVSSIRGLFNKDNAEWLQWISQGKSLYLNKEKIQDLIAKQRINLADVSYLDLNFVAKVVKNFENPKLYDEKNEETIKFHKVSSEKMIRSSYDAGNTEGQLQAEHVFMESKNSIEAATQFLNHAKRHSVMTKMFSEQVSVYSDDEDKRSYRRGFIDGIKETIERHNQELDNIRKRVDVKIPAYLKNVNDVEWTGSLNVYSSSPYLPVNHLSHAVKTHDEKAIRTVSDILTVLVRRVPNYKDAVLVPVPNSSGKAEYTLDLAHAISSNTGNPVADILDGQPHIALHKDKAVNGSDLLKLMSYDLKEELPKSKSVILIDNVLDTGTTAMSAMSTLGGNVSLVVLGNTVNYKKYNYPITVSQHPTPSVNFPVSQANLYKESLKCFFRQHYKGDASAEFSELDKLIAKAHLRSWSDVRHLAYQLSRTIHAPHEATSYAVTYSDMLFKAASARRLSDNILKVFEDSPILESNYTNLTGHSVRATLYKNTAEGYSPTLGLFGDNYMTGIRVNEGKESSHSHFLPNEEYNYLVKQIILDAKAEIVRQSLTKESPASRIMSFQKPISVSSKEGACYNLNSFDLSLSPEYKIQVAVHSSDFAKGNQIDLSDISIDYQLEIMDSITDVIKLPKLNTLDYKDYLIENYSLMNEKELRDSVIEQNRKGTLYNVLKGEFESFQTIHGRDVNALNRLTPLIETTQFGTNLDWSTNQDKLKELSHEIVSEILYGKSYSDETLSDDERHKVTENVNQIFDEYLKRDAETRLAGDIYYRSDAVTVEDDHYHLNSLVCNPEKDIVVNSSQVILEADKLPGYSICSLSQDKFNTVVDQLIASVKEIDKARYQDLVPEDYHVLPSSKEERNISKEDSVSDIQAGPVKGEESANDRKPMHDRWANLDYTAYRMKEGDVLERPSVYQRRADSPIDPGKWAIAATINGKVFRKTMYYNDVSAFFEKDESGNRTMRVTKEMLAKKYFGEYIPASERKHEHETQSAKNKSNTEFLPKQHILNFPDDIDAAKAFCVSPAFGEATEAIKMDVYQTIKNLSDSEKVKNYHFEYMNDGVNNTIDLPLPNDSEAEKMRKNLLSAGYTDVKFNQADSLKEINEVQQDEHEQEEEKPVEEKKPNANQIRSAILTGALLSAAENKEGDSVWLNFNCKSAPELYKSSETISPFNSLIMAAHSDGKGYKTNVFTTFYDGKANGLFVRSKQTSIPVSRLNFNYYCNKYDKSDVISKDIYEKLPDLEKELYAVMPKRQTYNVFNVDQTTLFKSKPDDYKTLVRTSKVQYPSSQLSFLSSIKQNHPDALGLFRCGDFYECYNDDAEMAAEILGITLTKSTKYKNEDGSSLRIAGFPHYALQTYLPKLVRAGQQVHISDQQLNQYVGEEKQIYDKLDVLIDELKKNDETVEVTHIGNSSTFDGTQLIINNARFPESGKELSLAVERANDTYRAIVAYTGAAARLNRAATCNVVPEDIVKYDKLIQELGAGVMMMRMGLPAHISEENMKFVPYWERELRENPELIIRLERDVDNAVKVMDMIEKGESKNIDYQKMRGEKSLSVGKVQVYSIISEINRLPNLEQRKMVVIKDKQNKSVDVILPEGASLQSGEETRGMSKNRIILALKKEGFEPENVKFFNAGGDLGLKKSNEYFVNKDIESCTLKQYALITETRLDVTEEIKQSSQVQLETVQVIRDDEDQWQMYVRPNKEYGDAFTCKPDPNDIRLFFDSIGKENNPMVIQELGQKYYNLVMQHPDRKTNFLMPNVSLENIKEHITHISISKDKDNDNSTVLVATIDGKRYSPREITRDQYQRFFLVPDKDEYKLALAGMVFSQELKSIGVTVSPVSETDLQQEQSATLEQEEVKQTNSKQEEENRQMHSRR